MYRVHGLVATAGTTQPTAAARQAARGLRMIRRKIWASATVCLALAGAAQAQTGTATRADLGNPGYPAFIPRNYVAPTPPGYSAPVASPASSSAISAPAELFAVGTEVGGSTAATPTAPPATPMPMPGTLVSPPMTGPAPMVVEPGTPMTMPMPGSPMLNGGPIVDSPSGNAPFLEGIGGYNTCDALPCMWISGEYLNWRQKGMSIPPLVTAAPAGSAGTIGDAGTVVAYGGTDILKDSQGGVRIRAGVWFQGSTSGLDVAFFTIGRMKDSAAFGSNGDPGIFRPFFNTAIGAEDAQLVSFIDPVGGPLLSGRVAVTSSTDFYGAEANYRQGFGTGLGGGRIDALIGYRYLRLHDTVNIQSNLVTDAAAGAAPAGTQIFSQDRFEALNQFNGGQVGLAGEWQLGSFTLGVRSTVALGITNQRINVAGGSGSSTPSGTTVSAPSGLFALPFNSGEHAQTQFSIVPEVGATLGYQVTNNIKVFGGYNLLYWTHVARAGEQIRRNVNGTYITDPTTGTAAPVGAPAPIFKMHDELFYSYGWTGGVEFRW
jgi:Putative beta barrel porin-7 (BBP7)